MYLTFDLRPHRQNVHQVAPGFGTMCTVRAPLKETLILGEVQNRIMTIILSSIIILELVWGHNLSTMFYVKFPNFSLFDAQIIIIS